MSKFSVFLIILLAISLQCVSPGVVETEIITAAGVSAEDANAFYSNNPVMKAEDVAETVKHIITAPSHVEVSSCSES